jgi:site-specific DNA recombinase
MKKNQTNEFGMIYRRKSSEGEDRQVASLDRQREEIELHILRHETLSIIKDYQEAQSAKRPGRKKFNEMCELLEQGKASYIVCWSLNRLARNPVDGGRILWLVQTYGVKIVTPGKTYDINDVMLMHVEFAMSNQFIIDLRKNSISGVQRKIKTGMAPTLAPVGYRNETQKRQGEKDISIDEERFPLVRKMWDLLLTGNYSVSRILDIATNEWGLRRANGNFISRSQVYEILTNIFYTGQFMYAGEVFQGIHQPMITLDEFDRSQKILGNRGRPRPQSHSFAFTGLMKCVCGSGITAHERYRKNCSHCHHKYNAQVNDNCPKCATPAPEKTWYTCLYHCTRRVTKDCHQPSIQLSKLEAEFDQVLATLVIPDPLIQWALIKLRKENKVEANDRVAVVKNITGAMGVVERKEKVLKEKFFSPTNENGALLSEEEYLQRLNDIKRERKILQDQLNLSTNYHENWLDNFNETFSFTKNAQYWLKNGTLERKRTIVASLGLNPILENKKIRIDLTKELNVMKQGQEVAQELEKRFEPEKVSYDLIEKAYNTGEFPVLGRVRDAIRTCFNSYLKSPSV